MTVTVLIPGQLRERAAGLAEVRLPGSPATVAEAFAALWRLHPGLRDRVMTETGEVRRHVNVFVGDESIRFTAGLATPLREGSEISIYPAVSGGGGFLVLPAR